jgi:hypothetical protein
MEIMNRSIVQKEDHKMDLEIKEHLLTKSPTMIPDWKRQFRWDETGILGMNAKNNERAGNSKALLHADRSEPSRVTREKLRNLHRHAKLVHQSNIQRE